MRFRAKGVVAQDGAIARGGKGMKALVIGGGPAGLMAAEALALAGHPVTVAEAMPTFGRKFLMAGKSGLNVTKDEPLADFLAAYDCGWLAPMVQGFGPEAVMSFCRGLGHVVFTGSSGRVFPDTMKGSPLLRSWLARLRFLGVDLRTRWRWQGFAGDALAFDAPGGPVQVRPQVTVLALGGASWARLGSDAAWVPWLAARGVDIAPFRPANMGFDVAWSAHMARHFGHPVKGARLTAGPLTSRGEFVVTDVGLEGGGIYALSRAMRDGAPLHVDLMPDVDARALDDRLSRGRSGESLANRLRKLGLPAVAVALVQEFGRGLPIATAIKALPIRHVGPRPLDEAISVAGGITRAALTDDLELRALPGMFAAGEMLDWEAPTGGYLLTASWATGLWAGRAAARKLA